MLAQRRVLWQNSFGIYLDRKLLPSRNCKIWGLRASDWLARSKWWMGVCRLQALHDWRTLYILLIRSIRVLRKRKYAWLHYLSKWNAGISGEWFAQWCKFIDIKKHIISFNILTSFAIIWLWGFFFTVNLVFYLRKKGLQLNACKTSISACEWIKFMC